MPQAAALSAAEFAAKWRDNARRESASSQEHFLDLCRLLGVPTPAEADPSGESYTFEAGVEKLGGGQGWADVWKRGHFGWEYKGDRADLAAAYRQLLDYREDLENPPALVVSDMDRIEVHTNFTNTRPRVHEITLDDLAAGGDRTGLALDILRSVMSDPAKLRPRQTPDEVTQAAATRFADLARSMQERGHDPEAVAHFLNRVLFCLFAEDVGLLPRRLMTDLVESRKDDPEEFAKGLTDLFRLMSDREAGRFFGTQRIEWFNGGLFDDDSVLPFTRDELRTVADASSLDWSQVEPAILGTLFERGLDPDKRGQLGAHYTDREKILMVVEPVVMTPLRREFASMQERVAALMKDRQPSPLTRDGLRRANLPRWERDAETEWRSYLKRLRDVRVLDPACGSGNFLYVTLRLLKDLEQEAIRWGAERLRITGEFPRVDPHNVLGIEINPYAKELAGVAIWIGHIQWMLDHGYGFPRDPVLQPLDNIELRDAILAYDEDGNPTPATWPEAEFIVGNPPFLGTKYMREKLTDPYVDDLFVAWDEEVARESDLVCYWHEQARRRIAAGESLRAGLLATNSIRGGANRSVLDEVKRTGDIFNAWSDEPWIVDGAAVRVSIVGQDNGSEEAKALDGHAVSAINSDLTVGVDVTKARALVENQAVAFMGDTKGGQFNVSGGVAREMLILPTNINGRSNADVVVPRVNAMDVARRPRDEFIVDFGTDSREVAAAEYEAPFEFIREHVKPAREQNRRKAYRERWWLHVEPRPAMRSAVKSLRRFIATPAVAKHRLFVWLEAPTLPDHALFAFAREDDYAFGVLHSVVHELWSLRTCTWLGKGNDPRYTPTTTFETFPFPWPLNTPDDALTPEQCEHRDAIGAAAKELDDKRRLWLNPPEWVHEVPDVVPSLPNRLLPVDDAAAEQLKQRTLTNLYNQRPTWLDNLHRTLDAAVFAAYGWPADIEDEQILERLLALNLKRASAES
ncbi:MAG: class I SAM-dependent DNA methyltransferase [Chloroflexota bacterium]|nr:class I SAM-dependent DNA methyltransferase [Chloroflexota bacterium]MDE2896678.1 class I SAM-dependent DNA methyltransferase [Chloroflexota bacterium]